MKKCLLGIFLIALLGCTAHDIPFVYKIDISQGNIITDEEVEKLEPGMTPAQVSFLMGTPLLVDSFHQDQWDYVYRFTPGSSKKWEGEEFEERLLRIYFKDGVVESFVFMEQGQVVEEVSKD